MRHVIGMVLLAGGLIVGFALLGAYLEGLSGGAAAAARGAAPAPVDEVSVEAGRAVFHGRGLCFACHSVGNEGSAIRGPNLGVKPPDVPEPLYVRAATAQPGKTAAEHIVQALYEPDAFVAAGFPRGVMMRMDAPPAALSHEQIRSVILYVLQAGGTTVTPELEEEIRAAQRPHSGEVAEADAADAGPPPPPPELPAGDASAGAAAFAELGCTSCHAPEGGEPAGDAPPASALARGRGESEVLLSILGHRGGETPERAAVPAGVRQLTVIAIADLAAYLRRAPEAAADAGAP